MKKTVMIAVTVALAIAMGTTAAMARGSGYGWGKGYGPGYGYGPGAIPNLTAEQSAKIQALQKAHLDEMAPLQQDLLKKKTEMRGLWLTQKPDQAKISALQKEILAIEAKIKEKSTNLQFEVRKVLTPEQQAQIAAFGPGVCWGKGKMGRMGRW